VAQELVSAHRVWHYATVTTFTVIIIAERAGSLSYPPGALTSRILREVFLLPDNGKRHLP
jgi:hypothetical protein